MSSCCPKELVKHLLKPNVSSCKSVWSLPWNRVSQQYTSRDLAVPACSVGWHRQEVVWFSVLLCLGKMQLAAAIVPSPGCRDQACDVKM